MNLRQLEALYHVITTGSVSEAANEMHRTQPAVTALIRGLEESIDLPLFDRRGRRLVPRPEAHYLFEEASVILERLNRARATMDSLRSLEAGTLRVAATLAASVSLVPSIFNELMAGSPHIKTSLVTGTSIRVHHLVASQQVDIGFGDLGYEHMQADTSLITYQPFKMDAVVAVADGHRLARNNTVSPSDLSGEPLALLSDEHHIHQAISDTFEAAGAAFEPRMQSQATLPKFPLIAAGTLVGIVDPLTARSYMELCGNCGHIQFIRFQPVVTYEFTVMTPNFRPPSKLRSAAEAAMVERMPSYLSID